MFRRATWMRGIVFLTNLFIVAYLVYVLLSNRRDRALRASGGPS